jgi:hypothetical protein
MNEVVMSDSNYQLEGHGPSGSRAKGDLSKKKTGLQKKLKEASVSPKLDLVQTTYSGTYTGKEDVAGLTCTYFELQSEHGFAHLRGEAKTRANGARLSSYDAKLTKREQYNLTQDQLDAAVGKKTKSPTGTNDLERADYSDNPFSRF